MLGNINFPEKLFVGVEKRGQFSTEKYPLAFATPYGTDKAALKRQETVLNWVGPRYEKVYLKDENGKQKLDEKGHYVYDTIDHGEYPLKVIDNVPLEGFKFEGAVSRWTTSNKWFEINDPRGFTLQISAYNLADILLNCTISNGVLQGFFIWGREGANNFLSRMNHPDYQYHITPKENYKIRPGDVLLFPNGSGEYQYLGEYYLTTFSIEENYISHSRGSWGNFSYTTKRKPSLSRDTKPWKLFYYKNPDRSYETIVARRSYGKYELVEKQRSISYFPEEKGFQHEPWLQGGPKGYPSLYKFYKTVDDQNSEPMGLSEIVEIFKSNKENSNYYHKKETQSWESYWNEYWNGGY